MTDLTKDEVVKMAREAGFGVTHQEGQVRLTGYDDDLERFATLCRAPLVAENAVLKQAHEINADTLNAMQVEIDDWKARALKAEQVGEPVAGDGARLAQELWLSVIHNIAYQNNGNSVLTGTTAMRELKAMIDHVCIGIDSPPKPAAQEPDCATTGVCVRSGLYASPPSAVPVVEQLVEALDGLFSGDVVVWSLGGSARPRAAIAAGQKYLKEDGK